MVYKTLSDPYQCIKLVDKEIKSCETVFKNADRVMWGKIRHSLGL